MFGNKLFRLHVGQFQTSDDSPQHALQYLAQVYAKTSVIIAYWIRKSRINEHWDRCVSTWTMHLTKLFFSLVCMDVRYYCKIVSFVSKKHILLRHDFSYLGCLSFSLKIYSIEASYPLPSFALPGVHNLNKVALPYKRTQLAVIDGHVLPPTRKQADCWGVDYRIDPLAINDRITSMRSVWTLWICKLVRNSMRIILDTYNEIFLSVDAYSCITPCSFCVQLRKVCPVPHESSVGRQALTGMPYRRRVSRRNP